MKHTRLTRSLVSILLFSLCLPAFAAGANALLWQIGKADHNTAEFALGPGGWNQYSARFPHDVLFVVGQSDAKRDWPYVQPGPVDTWAGGKSHTFAILFGLKATSTEGRGELVLNLVDTQNSRPPKMEIKINSASFVRDLPRGAGDASVGGQPEKGREYRLVIDFPARILKVGGNQITITSSAGSWVLYDQVTLSVPSGVQAGPVKPASKLLDVHSGPYMVKGDDGRLYQPVMASVLCVGKAVEAALVVNGVESAQSSLGPGFNVIEARTPAVDRPTPVEVDVRVAGKSLGKQTLTLEPVRKWEVWLLHHSHVDIGYTQVQTEVEHRHWQYYEQVMDLARKTADYPAGSRFKWNVEVLWAVDGFLKQAIPQQRQAFIEAVKKGWIGLDALYGNELTALCRPEELVNLIDYARLLKQRFGVTIDSAMISDVPGYTWGIVPVLARSGVKYFSVGPNRGDRIGYTLSTWGDRPFYWVSPSGRNRILCWVAGEGYSYFHGGRLGKEKLFSYLKRLAGSQYPYDMVQLRYTVGDNGAPDPDMSDFVRNWNAKYAYPKLIVATTSEMFHEFERRYGDKLPTFRGDFTPYWEDGAASSARETATNREAAERLVQAETLWAMLDPVNYPAEQFREAWRNVVLYDEHTWGAYCSISQPESDFTKAQWKIKQAFALNAELQSRNLLSNALAGRRTSAKTVAAVDVFNTSSWTRTDLVVLPKILTVAGDVVKDSEGRAVKSQRLSTGRLAFLAKDVAPFSAKRFTFHTGTVSVSGKVSAEGAQLSNGAIRLIVDRKTGAIESLSSKGLDAELVDRRAGPGLNDYFYVAGRDPKDRQRNGPVTIRIKERGPLVASLLVESDAPGCNKLVREMRVVDGIDRVDIIDVIDKKNIYKPEAVHLAFPFNVPEGVMRMQTPWAVVRPETDQLPGACKNFFTVQRWVDVSNQNYGVTWATVDAPLIEVGAIRSDPKAVGWIQHIEPSTTLYSYVMNNYWHTNYKASQEGPTTFRYSIEPHGRYDGGSAARFGAERSQPLVVVPVEAAAAVRQSVLSVEPGDVVVTAFKPSSDGKAWIVRLFNAGQQPQKAALAWARPAPATVWLSDLAEEEISKIGGPIEMAPYEIVTLRASMPEK
jgi:alpha-mannosidase